MDMDRIDWDLDYEDDADCAELDDEADVLAEYAAEQHLDTRSINVLGLDPAALD